ncbi:MAG: hypothetical protein WBI04_06900 [Trichlorobacter sp.]
MSITTGFELFRFSLLLTPISRRLQLILASGLTPRRLAATCCVGIRRTGRLDHAQSAGCLAADGCSADCFRITPAVETAPRTLQPQHCLRSRRCPTFALLQPW